jgi:guanylate kinase
MEQFSHYDYLVANDDLDTAYRYLKSVILSARVSQKRMTPLATRILRTFETSPQE